MSGPFKVNIEHWENFQFLINFGQDGVPELLSDEAAPLGEGKGPNPARLLAAAVGNCLAASLLFCLKKSHIEPHRVSAVVEGEMTRNERGRMRITELRVRLEPAFDEADLPRISRCSELYEDFCIVTESVRNGIDVQVELNPVVAETLTL
jgi:uncharacterized OsmC-like protein